MAIKKWSFFAKILIALSMMACMIALGTCVFFYSRGIFGLVVFIVTFIIFCGIYFER